MGTQRFISKKSNARTLKAGREFVEDAVQRVESGVSLL